MILKIKKLKTIVKGDYKLNRIPDHTHPILNWHPKGKILAIFEEKKGSVWLNSTILTEIRKIVRKFLVLKKFLVLHTTKKVIE